MPLFLLCSCFTFYLLPPPTSITAIPCAVHATNFKTCPESPWNLHHWCNEGMLLCGYNYYYSICVATERLKGIIWGWCWFNWDQNLTVTSLWKSSWERGFASSCLPAMLQSWGFSQALSCQLCSSCREWVSSAMKWKAFLRWGVLPYHLLSSFPVLWPL